MSISIGSPRPLNFLPCRRIANPNSYEYVLEYLNFSRAIPNTEVSFFSFRMTWAGDEPYDTDMSEMVTLTASKRHLSLICDTVLLMIDAIVQAQKLNTTEAEESPSADEDITGADLSSISPNESSDDAKETIDDAKVTKDIP